MSDELGITIRALPDIGDRLELISGNMAVAQAISFRLSTPRGSLWRYPNYGFDIRVYSSRAMTKTSKYRLESSINQEVLKDERVYKSVTKVDFDESNQKVTITLALLTKFGPFKLVLLASDTLIDIIEAQRNG